MFGISCCKPVGLHALHCSANCSEIKVDQRMMCDEVRDVTAM